ncbi:TonB-dependent receptor [Glacieibacterium sp.]|uniref:TonB-dependent receptor n=1 Tax=Glacieibacterium sp. TaxID=2860237 RepID=UPI003B00D713
MLVNSPVAAQVASNTQIAAANTDAGDYQSSDIVVTAQKRAEALIDVPQSISVVRGETLERQQAFSFQDYAKLVPGLQISQSNPGEARLILRGVNTGGTAATVSTYVDETPFGSSSGLANGAILAGELDTFDMARVEVLRGPQGTLYGASSLSGVVKFVTNAPDFDRIESRSRASVETVEGGDLSYMGSALVNVPLTSNLAVRASGFYRKFGGFIDSTGLGGSDIAKNINDSKSYGGRVSALFKPSTAVSLRLTAIVQNLDSNASAVVESDPRTLRTITRNVQSRFVPEYTDVAYRLYNGTLDVDLGFATLTSSTSYSTLKESLRDDLTVYFGSLLGLYTDATGPAADLAEPQHTNNKRFTQELRLASPQSDTFEWMIGGYYNHEKAAIIQQVEAYNPGTFTTFAGLPQLFDGALTSRYEEFAGFANGTLHFGPRFDLTVGGRYSGNNQNAHQDGVGLLAPAELSSSSKEQVFTWSAAPKFKFSDTGSIYARFAKGFRPGGPNIVPPTAPPEVQTYKSDSVINYELGLKAETADRSFGIDISAFHIDWDDIQLLAQVGAYGVNANGGKATSDGVEFTATVRPTRGFAVTINGAYTDAKLTENTDPIVGGRKGDRLPFSPKVSVSVNGDYDWSVGTNATAYVGASLRYLGDQAGLFSPAYTAAYGGRSNLPAYAVADLRAGVEFGRFSIGAYAKNLGNVAGKTSVVESFFPRGATGTGVIRPRTIGLTFGAGF